MVPSTTDDSTPPAGQRHPRRWRWWALVAAVPATMVVAIVWSAASRAPMDLAPVQPNLQKQAGAAADRATATTPATVVARGSGGCSVLLEAPRLRVRADAVEVAARLLPIEGEPTCPVSGPMTLGDGEPFTIDGAVRAERPLTATWRLSVRCAPTALTVTFAGRSATAVPQRPATLRRCSDGVVATPVS